MSNFNDNNMKNEIESLFPDESIYDVIGFIKKMKKLIPIGSKNELAYLEEIIVYVDGLINGDIISQYSTYNSLSKYAKEAFDTIIHSIHKQILESYKQEKWELETSIDSLLTKQKVLTEDVSNLQQQKTNLQNDTFTLALELLKIKEELKKLKAEGVKKVHAELDSEKESIQSEISTLKSEKDNLTTATGELKSLLSNYNHTILSLGWENSANSCTWEPVKEDDAIYNTNATTIASYVSSLKLTYQEKMGVSEEECEKEFQKHCPGLQEFVSILKKYTNPIPACSSVTNIIESDNWLNKANFDTQRLIATLKLLKMPTYSPKNTNNIDSYSITPDTIPNNMNIMLRELYLQRVAMEAVAKQKILEAELKSVIGILKNVVPQDFDFTPLLQMYGQMDSLLSSEFSEDTKPKL